jgi:hypothetical protein
MEQTKVRKQMKSLVNPSQNFPQNRAHLPAISAPKRKMSDKEENERKKEKRR